MRFLGAHVPVSVCTPPPGTPLTGRLPSSSPFFSGTRLGKSTAQVDVSWNTWIEEAPADLRDDTSLLRPWRAAPVRTVDAHVWLRAAQQDARSMLQASANYFTGFVGKWHLSSMPYQLNGFRSGREGHFPSRVTDATAAAAAAQLQRRFSEARETHFAPLVRRAGFNYTGALSVGNVLDWSALGAGVHNMDWEAQAGLEFLDLAASHVAAGRAAAYYLHLCTTPPTRRDPIAASARTRVCRPAGCARLGADGALPPRASILARTGATQACARAEHDAAHTLWVDDAVGALLGKLRSLGDEENTLFIVLADHQRVGKGTLYHGIRTPMVLQFPARVPGGQTLPASTLVSTLDVVPTVLDAAGLSPTRRTHPTTPPRYRTTRGGASTAGASCRSSRAPRRERRLRRLLRRRGGATSSTRSLARRRRSSTSAGGSSSRCTCPRSST